LTEFRYIDWPEYGRLTKALAGKVRKGGETFELAVGIARGGIPVAMVVSDILDLKIDYINVKSYVGIAERTSPRIISPLSEDIHGKKVLLVDDLVDHGVTMKMLKTYLKKMGPKVLRTAVLFKKPWSATEPDYFVEASDNWIVFPFEVGEVARQRKESTGRQESANVKVRRASP
jgi:uncharacterized protein